MIDTRVQPFGPNAIEGDGNAKRKQPGRTGKSSFGDFLKESIEEVNRLQNEADTSMTDFATGKTKDIQNVMMSVQKADLSFRLMQKIRNKLVDAYQEIMRMGV